VLDLGVLGCRGTRAGGAGFDNAGVEGCSSSSLVLSGLSPKTHLRGRLWAMVIELSYS
jgi:hypothetical protein